MSPEERPTQDRTGQDPARSPSNAAPKSNAINMALAELQGDLAMPEDPTPSATMTPPPPSPSSNRLDPGPRPPASTANDRAGDPGDRNGKEPAPALSATTVEASPAASTPTATANTAGAPPATSLRDRIGQGAGHRDLPRDRILSPAAPTATAGGDATRDGLAVPPLGMLIASGLTSLIFGLLGAWAFHHFAGGPAKPANSTDEAATTAPASTSPASAPGSPTAADLEPLKARIDDLAGRVEAIAKKRDEAARPSATTSDLTGLKERIEAVAKAQEAVVPISNQVKELNGRIAALEKSGDSFREELTKARAAAERAATGAFASNPPPDSERRDHSRPLLEDVHPSDEAMAQGIDLFKQNRYRDAFNVFNRLTKSKADDARVWYFAALSNGFATDQWTPESETAKLVNKGVDRERAGTPSSAQIDAAFRDLTDANGKGWLAFYRAKIRRP